jgi:hypothetical protein
MYNYEDEDDDDELFPIDLPDTEKTVSYLVSQFFIEADRKEKRVNKEVSRLLDRLYEKHGEDQASISLMNYIGAKMGWDIEILMEKFEVEDYLMNAHNIFDENIWRKVLGTSAMSDFRREVFSLSQTYLTRAVREVLAKEQPNTSPAGDPLL